MNLTPSKHEPTTHTKLFERLTNPDRWKTWTDLQRREWRERMDQEHCPAFLTLEAVTVKDVHQGHAGDRIDVEFQEPASAEFHINHKARLLLVERGDKITVNGIIECIGTDYDENNKPVPSVRLTNCSFQPYQP